MAFPYERFSPIESMEQVCWNGYFSYWKKKAKNFQFLIK